MSCKFKVGDLVIQDLDAPYPNCIYKVTDVLGNLTLVDGGWRGIPAIQSVPGSPKKKSQWYGDYSFRKVERQELLFLRNQLTALCEEMRAESNE